MAELLGNANYLEIVLLVSVVFSLVSVFVVQQSTKKKSRVTTTVSRNLLIEFNGLFVLLSIFS